MDINQQATLLQTIVRICVIPLFVFGLFLFGMWAIMFYKESKKVFTPQDKIEGEGR